MEFAEHTEGSGQPRDAESKEREFLNASLRDPISDYLAGRTVAPTPAAARVIEDKLDRGEAVEAGVLISRLSSVPAPLFESLFSRLRNLKWTRESLHICSRALADSVACTTDGTEKLRIAVLAGLSRHLNAAEPEFLRLVRNELFSGERRRTNAALVLVGFSGRRGAALASDLELLHQCAPRGQKLLAAACLCAAGCPATDHIEELLEIHKTAEAKRDSSMAITARAVISFHCRVDRDRVIDCVLPLLSEPALCPYAVDALYTSADSPAVRHKFEQAAGTILSLPVRSEAACEHVEALIGGLPLRSIYADLLKQPGHREQRRQLEAETLKESLPNLTALLANRNETLSVRAAEWLDLPRQGADIGVRRAVAELEGLPAKETEKTLRQSFALLEILTLFARICPDETARILIPLVRSSNIHARRAALAALPHTGSCGAAALPRMIALLSAADSAAIEAVPYNISAYGKAALPFLQQILRTMPAAHMRLPLLGVLLHGILTSDVQEARDGLIAGLSSSHPQVRLGSALLLLRCLEKDLLCGLPFPAVERLEQLMHASHPKALRETAAGIFGYAELFPERAFRALKTGLLQEQSVQLAAIASLGRLRAAAHDAFPVLAELLPQFPVTRISGVEERKPYLILWQALANSAKAAPRERTEFILDLLQRKEQDEPADAGTVAGSLYVLTRLAASDREAHDRLAEAEWLSRYLHENRPQSVRAHVCHLLKRLGPLAASAGPKLIEYARFDPDNYVRELCHVAIGKIGEPREAVLHFLLFAWDEWLKNNSIPIHDRPDPESARSTWGSCFGLAALLEREPRIEREFARALREEEYRSGGRLCTL
jgi:hypothetical protein